MCIRDSLEVECQDSLGVVGSAMYSFIGNLTHFPAVKDFENQLRFDKIIITRGWRVF